jgi:hypothetical protein
MGAKRFNTDRAGVASLLFAETPVVGPEIN